MTMPKQKPHRSFQSYQTPPELLAAIKKRLCINYFDIDLAATRENAVCPYYYSLEEGQDSLDPRNSWQVPEPDSNWSWLNPPYADIRPWVSKAWNESRKGAQIVMLIPASVGANWWKDYVAGKVFVSFLNDRIPFVGCDNVYPKDCALLFYTPWGFHGYEYWSWQSGN